MPFPEAKRVIYRQNPLDKVICQLRFPPILRIDADIPARFQDLIRMDFPNFAESTDIKIELPPEARGQVPPELLRKATQSTGSKNYEFSSEDGNWVINLTRTFIALTANNYTRWEDFVEKFTLPMNALVDIYKPTSYTRVGLRYIDVIRRSRLTLSDVCWSELLKPYILGILGSSDIGNQVKNFESRYEVGLEDEKSVVRIVTQFVEAIDNGELCYRIDSDFFNTSKTEIEDALSVLEYFNSQGSRLIQWCITDLLHEAMEPQEL